MSRDKTSKSRTDRWRPRDYSLQGQALFCAAVFNGFLVLISNFRETDTQFFIYFWKIMAMGRGFRAFQINPGINANKENSIILEQRGKNEVILFENYALASLATQEFESMRKNYTKIVDAYGCLGVLVRKNNWK